MNLLQHYTDLAQEGTKASVDEIMAHLNMDMSIAESKIIDFALGLVEGDEGLQTMEHYLFHGTQVQRNYCTLYFARRGEYLIVRKAYDMGLVDALQAFSRQPSPPDPLPHECGRGRFYSRGYRP